MDCGIREYELYFKFANNYVPNTLRNLYTTHKSFYVKGGKAVDEYLRKKIGSPDWDVFYYLTRGQPEKEEVHQNILSVLNTFLRDFVNVDNTNIISEKATFNEPGKEDLSMIQYGIQQGSCKLLFLDVVFTVEEFPGSTLREGIPYQKRDTLMGNVETILRNRIDQVKQAENYGSLASKSFDNVVSEKIQSYDEDIQDLLRRIKVLCSNCEQKEEIIDLIEELQEYEQAKAVASSYKDYLEFKELQSVELDRIKKRNLTQKRRNRLRNAPRNQNAGRRRTYRRRS